MPTIARAKTFGINMCYYYTQIKFIVELDHAPCSHHKSIKTEFQP